MKVSWRDFIPTACCLPTARFIQLRRAYTAFLGRCHGDSAVWAGRGEKTSLAYLAKPGSGGCDPQAKSKRSATCFKKLLDSRFVLRNQYRTNREQKLQLEQTCTMSAKPEHSTSLTELRRRIADLEGRLPFKTQFAPAPASAANPQGPDKFSPQGTEGDLSPPVVSRTRRPEKGNLREPDTRCLLGMEALDSLFQSGGDQSGGLQLGALHEVVSSESRNAGALSGFAFALLARVLDLRPGPVLVVQDVRAAQEAGRFHGAGLVTFGIDPARLIVVRVNRLEDLLWCLEEGATCSALAAVIGEIQGAQQAVGLTASRRIALRAGRSAVPVVLLRHGAVQEPTAAVTRWQITPAISRAPEFLKEGSHAGLGAPVWTVDLTRNREGRPGRLTVEWDHARRTFAVPAHSLALGRRSALRPDPAPAAGKVHTLRPAG